MYALSPLARQSLSGALPTELDGEFSKPCALAHCSSRHCPILKDLGTLKSFRLNETMFWESDDATSYFMIKSGVVRGYRMLDDGRRQICRFVFPYDLVAHAFHCNYSYTAEAVMPVTALVIPRAGLDHCFDEIPCLRKLFLESLLEEMHQMQGQLLVLGRMSALERVAHFLYSLAKRTGANPLVLPMTRVDIADYLGLTLETVSRVTSRLKREGKIELLNTNEILISSPQGLSQDCHHIAA